MKLTYFHKNPGAIKIAIVIAAVLIVVVPLRNTIVLTFKYGELKSTMKTYLNANRNTAASNQDERLLEDFDHEKKIFEEVSKACQEYKVIVKQVDLPKMIDNGGVVTETQQILLEGDYVNILKSLRNINNALDAIKIANVKFEREENNKRIALVAHVIFQSVKLADENDEN
jgi:hypothetical protein